MSRVGSIPSTAPPRRRAAGDSDPGSNAGSFASPPAAGWAPSSSAAGAAVTNNNSNNARPPALAPILPLPGGDPRPRSGSSAEDLIAGRAVTLPRPVVSTTLPTYKVLVIGDAGVGKSNLLSRFASNKFDITTRSTIGVEFTSREIDVGTNEKVNVQLWDTAGCERQNSISSAFFRNARGIAVCYDVTRKASLLNVPRWVAHARQYCDENCQFVVIGNKTDLKNIREVTEEEAEEISHILSTRHYYASALTGDGVPTAFLQLILSVHAVALTQPVSSPKLPAGRGGGAPRGGNRGVVLSGSSGGKRRSDVDTRGFGNPDFAKNEDPAAAGKRKKPCCGD